MFKTLLSLVHVAPLDANNEYLIINYNVKDIIKIIKKNKKKMGEKKEEKL